MIHEGISQNNFGCGGYVLGSVAIFMGKLDIWLLSLYAWFLRFYAWLLSRSQNVGSASLALLL